MRRIKSSAQSTLRSWVQTAVYMITYAALGTFHIILPQWGKRSIVAPDNLEKSLFYFNLAEQIDDEQSHCLPRVMCEAAFLGKQKGSTLFHSTVSAIAVNISKRKPSEIVAVKKMKGGHIAASILLGNAVTKISKCKNVSKKCTDKHNKHMHHQMEKVMLAYENNNSSSVQLNTILDSEEEELTTRIASNVSD